jgi:hypothetical protein
MPALPLRAPIPDPDSVTLVDPVDARLAGDADEIATMSYETLMLVLPTLAPDVTLRRKVLATLVANMLAIVVSETHSVASGAVPPALSPGENAPCRPIPDRVRLVDPVTALFNGNDTSETCTESYVMAAVMLAACLPTVTPSRSVPANPAVRIPTVDVADAHWLASYELTPTRMTTLPLHVPSPDPDSVTLMDPVPAPLAADADDTTAMS